MSSTTVGSVKQLVKLDLSELRQDFAEMKAFMNKQLSMQSLAFQKMGAGAKTYGQAVRKANIGVVNSFNESVKSALSMERIVGRLAFIGTVGAVYALGRAISSAFGQGTEDARKFEKALAHINTVLDDSAKHFMPTFKRGIESMSLQFGESVEVLSKSLYDIVSARIDPAFALNVLNEITTLAVANQAELKDVTTAVVGVMNAYNYSALNASEVTDKLQATVKYGRMELQDMAGTLGRVTAAAAALGISLDDVLGSLATMTRQGMNARESVTALRRMLLKLSEDANLSAKIQKEGLLAVIPIMELMTTKQKVMFAGGIRGFNAAIIAMKNYVSQGKDVEAIANSEEEALKALGIEADTSALKLKQAQEEWKRTVRDGFGGWKNMKAGLLSVSSDIVAGILSIGYALKTVASIGSWDRMKENFNKTLNMVKVGTGYIDDMTSAQDRMAKAFSFMPLEGDPSNVDNVESVNSALATQKEELSKLLVLDKKRYDNAVANAKGEEQALNNLKNTWQQYIEVLRKISDIGGDAFPDFEEQLLDTDTAFKNFLASFKETAEKIKEVDPVKEQQNSFREILRLYETYRGLGQDVLPQITSIWMNHIKKMTELLGENHILVRQAKADWLEYLDSLETEPELSDYEKWKEKIVQTGTDIKAYWATFANEMDGISGVSANNITEHYEEIYEAFKEMSPRIAEMFAEEMRYISEEMQQLQDAWVGSMSGGISRMVQDMLDGVNMMKKNWAEYLKYIVDSFIAALARMAAEKAAYAVFDLIVGALTGGGGVPSGVLASIPNVPNTGGISSPSSNVVNNFNPSFNPNINVGATFSQRDMAFIYKTGKSYYGKTSL